MRALAPAALLLAITAGFYWKLTLTSQFSWAEDPVVGRLIAPALDLEARELRMGRFGLWDSKQWGGESLLARAQSGAANPLLLPLFAMPLRDGHMRLQTLHWWWVGLHWLAALLAYGLCRELGARQAGALLGASVFAMGGVAGAALAPQILAAALWIPAVLWSMARVLSGKRATGAAAGGGAALGAAFLSGNFEIPLFLAIAAAGLWIYAAATARERRSETARAAALFLALALLTSAADWLPRLVYGWTAGRESVAYTVQWAGAASARALLGLVVPGWSDHANAFLGAIAVLLAMAGLAMRWEERATRALAATAAGAAAVALGGDLLFHGALYAALPWVAKAHTPAFAIAIAQASLAGLAALGFDGWREWRGARKAHWILAGFASLVLLTYLVLGVARMRPEEERPAAAALAALLAAAALAAWERGGLSRRGAAAAVIGLALVEVGTVSSPLIPDRARADAPLRKLLEHRDLAAFLHGETGWFRIDVDEKEIAYNFGDWFGVEQVGGASAPSSPRVASLPADDRRRLLGMRYYLGRTPSHPDQVSLYQGSSGIRVFGDGRGWRPYWVEPDGGRCDAASDVQLESRRSQGTVFRADMPCAGVLVTGDVYAAGWRAWVDGKRTPIREMHGLVRGVAVPQGRHRIEILYRPTAVYAGLGLTAAGLLLGALGVRRSGRAGKAAS